MLFVGISTFNILCSIDPDTPNYDLIEEKNQKEGNIVTNLDELMGNEADCKDSVGEVKKKQIKDGQLQIKNLKAKKPDDKQNRFFKNLMNQTTQVEFKAEIDRKFNKDFDNILVKDPDFLKG